MPTGKAWATSGWDELPEGRMLAYPDDPDFPSRVRGAIKRLEQQIDYVRGTVSGVAEYSTYTATLPVLVASNVISLSGLTGLGGVNRVIGMNNAGTGLEYKVVSGVVNQVNISHSANTIELSTPQDSHTGASPTFAGLTLTGLTASRLLATTGGSALGAVANLASWIAGTADQVTVTDDLDGTVTLSLPQSVHTGASPTFAGLALSALAASRLLATDGSKALTSVANLAAWVAGSANQVTVTDDGDGTITLSLPQNVHTGASPTFAGLTITGGRADFSAAAANYASIRIGGMGGNPTSPATGDLWVDTNFNALVGRFNGLNQYGIGLLYVQTLSGTVAGTGTETNMLAGGVGGTTVAANVFKAGKTLRFRFCGHISTKAGAVGNLTIRLKSTNYTPVTWTITGLASSLSTEPFEMTAVMTLRTTGVGGTMCVTSRFSCDQDDSGSIDEGLLITSPTMAWDTTRSEAFTLTAQWATADAANSITTEIATMEVLC